MTKPRSPHELEKQAVITVDPSIPIKLYFRSADLLLKQARVYKLENDLEHAYVLYMKYTNLGLSELPKHPAYKTAENKKSLRVLNKNCLEALEALESLKPALEKVYSTYLEQTKKAQKAEEEASITQQTAQWRSQQQQQQQQQPQQQQQRSVQVSDNSSDWSLQDALKGIAGVGLSDSAQTLHSSHHPTTNYPSLSLHNESDGFAYHAQQQSNIPSYPKTVPHLPPKPSFSHLSSSSVNFNQSPLPPKLPNQPALPPKIPIVSNRGPELPPKVKLEEKEVHRSGPTTDASTERGEPLRKMLLPEGIQSKFLSIARANTDKKIETCGILAGTLKNNILKITTLIIPKQTGTSDTCTTENEEDLFDIQDKHDLLTFGWIHTHPTQSCFLSSVDLHTHCSYQLMLPEAIAIVCAPSQKPNFGIFRLTDPPGLDIISNCKKTPAFHPHPDLPIYTGAELGGHVTTASYDFTVLDLRDKK